MDKQKERVAKIKRKFGETSFVRWGKLGGNPVLISQGRGDKIIIKHRQHK